METHGEVLDRYQPAEWALARAKAMRGFDHPIRLQILQILQGGERQVKEIWGELGVLQTVVSQHLAVLRESGVVCSERAKVTVKYSINPEYEALVAAVVGEHRK